MKNCFTLRLKMLMLFSAFVTTVSLTAATEVCTNDAISQDIILSIPNDGSITENTEITVKAQFDIPFAVRSVAVVEEPRPSNKQPISRSVILKDGKVDVDIIIRGSDIMPFLSPFNVAPQVRVKLGVINYITVDNISGVFESNETDPNGNIASRILSVEIADENIPQNESYALSQMFALDTENQSSTISVSDNRKDLNSDLVLFPNPVRDHMLNLRLSSSEAAFSEILVFNSLGSLVYQEKVNGLISGIHTVALPSMPSGVYFIKLHSATNELVKKFNIVN